jgi:DNA-binding SARP family transcriptional activator
VPAGPPRQRAVLAALLVDAGRLVTVETLVDRVWGEAPPNQVRDALYPYITRVRRLLAEVGSADGTPARILRRTSGYLLDIDTDLVDLHRFRRLIGQARDGDRRDDQPRGLLREALGLWRGEPLSDVTGAWAERTRPAWRQEYLDVVMSWRLLPVPPPPVITAAEI